ncbi:MAG: ROK family protein, partial [Planctomycetes bacterium]|nr:ROK family protein [Planctomycetota bacterium]
MSADDSLSFNTRSTRRGSVRHRVPASFDRPKTNYSPMTIQPNHSSVAMQTKENAKFPLFLGVDVGGTGIKIGLVDNVGSSLGFISIPTEEPKGPDDAMRRVAAACDQLLTSLGYNRTDVARVGLGTPGSQNITKGLLIEPPNHPHWHHFPIVQSLEEKLGLKVSFANDANAAAFG